MSETLFYRVIILVERSLSTENLLKSEFTVLLRYVWSIVLKHCAIILMLLFAFGFTEREILGFIR